MDKSVENIHCVLVIGEMNETMLILINEILVVRGEFFVVDIDYNVF
jgi:hypothetical protein